MLYILFSQLLKHRKPGESQRLETRAAFDWPKKDLEFLKVSGSQRSLLTSESHTSDISQPCVNVHSCQYPTSKHEHNQWSPDFCNSLKVKTKET